MKLFMLMSITLSLSTTITHNPTFILIIILIQSMISCMMISTIMSYPYMSYILFLIFMGAMMVTFIYITSLTSNELKINLQNIINTKTMILVLIMFFMQSTMNHTNKTLYMKTANMMKIIFMDPYFMTLTTMIFMLVTLLVVSSMCHLKTFSMRSLMKM